MTETISNNEDITEILLKRSRIEVIPEDLFSKRDEFEAIYKKLPIIADKLLHAYKEVLLNYGLKPGEVRLYMVGGRVRGTPLKHDSDIDLIFCVENTKQAPESIIPEGPWSPLEAQDYKVIMKREIVSRLSVICQEENISYHFHIINYGNKIPEHKVDNNQTLLLGKI